MSSKAILLVEHFLIAILITQREADNPLSIKATLQNITENFTKLVENKALS